MCKFVFIKFSFFPFVCSVLFRISRYPICIRLMEATQPIHGCHMQHIMDTLMQHMLMLHKRTLIIIIWHNMVVYLGYRNIMVTALGSLASFFLLLAFIIANQMETKIFIKIIFFPLHIFIFYFWHKF